MTRKSKTETAKAASTPAAIDPEDQRERFTSRDDDFKWVVMVEREKGKIRSHVRQKWKP